MAPMRASAGGPGQHPLGVVRVHPQPFRSRRAVSGPGLSRMVAGMPWRPMSCTRPARRTAVDVGVGQSPFGGGEGGELGDGA